LGKGAAVRFGLEYATGDLILIQDADLELDPNDYPKLLEPILKGETDIVYGSRFMGRKKRMRLKTYFANKFLVLLTNLLFFSNLSDMETAYKLFRREIINRIRLKCVGFELEPEITAKFLRLGYKIKSIPISYQPRSFEEGKKISWYDGIKAVYYLLKYRIAKKESFLR
jgi:glycosyltransferase involved in cell wall biosynthesis